MPLPGGAADKFGNRYEGIWTVQCIVDILAGRADSIRLEPPGEEGEGIEFWLKRGTEIQCHQVKRQNASGHWTIADLGNKGILGHFWNKLENPSASCVFVSTNSAYPLEELSDRSKRSASLYEFNHEFVKAQSIYDALIELRLRWNDCTDQEAYSALQRISIETISERSLRTTTERELGILVDGNPANAVDVLAQFALDKVHHELNADDIWKHLDGRGFLRSKIVKSDPVAGEFTYPTPLYFVGRAKTLDELDKAIVNNSTIVVGGLAGIGKTYLVSRYVENIDVSRTVLWFDCGAYEQTEKVLVRLAEFFGYKFGDEALLGLLRSPLGNEQRRMEIAAQLCDKYECTLVLDSLNPEIHKTLLIFIEECNRIFRRGRILITTRTSPEFATVINPVYRLTVPPLTREDGIQLMRHYLMRLGLEIYPEELLKEAYDRVEGHPYFMRALIVLSETYPLSDILRSLPQLTLQIQRYLQEQVFLQLTKDAIDLIARLSLLRVPFTLAAIQRFDTSPTSADSFDLLLRKFLVTRQSRRSSLYEIHDLVREYGQRQLSNEQIRLTHVLATDYYEALDKKTYSDMMEIIYHSLEADLRERAAQTGEYLVSHALHQGLFDLVIDYTSQLLRDQRAENWAVVYFGRGRALRFKNRFAEALECYENALGCSLTTST